MFGFERIVSLAKEVQMVLALEYYLYVNVMASSPNEDEIDIGG